MAKSCETNIVRICDYGCGKIAKYRFKNGKWCCSQKYNSCEESRRKVRLRFENKNNCPMFGKKHSKTAIEKIKKANMGISNPMWGKSPSKVTRRKVSVALKGRKSPNQLTIEKIKERYPLFYEIEDLRYNNKKEIQVRCKNHLCKNSKEKDGWFTPTYGQLYERIRQIETGVGGCFLYCSDKCKDECPLFNLHSDPFKEMNQVYTYSDYQTFRLFVLERDKYICQYCEEPATDVHHERPQKLDPFFSFDPDFAWSCCEKCHYEKGHVGDCSTGNLSKKTC